MDVSTTPGAGDLAVTETAQTLHIRSGSLTVDVDKYTARLTFGADDGAITVREDMPVAVRRSGARAWMPLRNVEHWRVDGETVVLLATITEDDRQEVEIQIGFPLRRSCQVRVLPNAQATIEAVRMQFDSAPDEHFFGTGERFSTVDQRGKRLSMWADDQGTKQADGHPWTYWPTPFFISNHGYGFFLNSTSRSDFDLCAMVPTSYCISAYDPSPTYEIFFGPHPLSVLDLYTQRTGRPADGSALEQRRVAHVARRRNKGMGRGAPHPRVADPL